MDAINDLYAKHGALAADKKPSRDSSGRFAPKPSKPAEPAWRRAKIGNFITVAKGHDHEAGTFEVVAIRDAGADTLSRLAVKYKHYSRWWIRNEKVLEIAAGPPKTLTPAEQAKAGDWISMTETYDTPAGVYEVAEVDEKATGSYRVRIFHGEADRKWWVPNSNIAAIVPKPEIDIGAIKVGDRVRVIKTTWFEAGTYEVIRVGIGDVVIQVPGDTWYAGPSHIQQHFPKARDPEKPLWQTLEVGDFIEIAGSSRDEFTPFSIERAAGVYEVGRIDSSDERLPIEAKGGDWIPATKILRKVDRPVNEATPLDRETILTIEVGDRVRVKGSTYVNDGEHEVMAVDFPSRNESVKVKDPARGTWWVGDNHVFGLIKKSSQEGSVPKDSEAYLKAKINDIVRIEGADDPEDGNYRVIDVDEGDSMRLKVDDNDGGIWVYNGRVKSIVTKATDAEKPVYKRAKRGDTVRVSGYSDYKSGDYVVHRAEPASYTGDYNLEVKLSDRSGDTTWIRNKDVLSIVDPTVAATKDESAFRQAKVGDTIRVSRGTDHPAGEYVVTKVEEGASHRLGVDYEGRNDRVWWVRNSVVEAVTSTRQGAVAVRGNCLIHVDVPTIMSNRSNNRHDPVIVARRLASVATVEKFRELAWDGPSRFVHHHFQRIEGTDVQNWVETDAPLTAWKPDGTIDVLNPIPGTVLDDMRAMTKPILGAFVIHIAAPVLAKNRKEGRNDPVIAVRRAHSNWATDVVFARKVEWNGPSRMVHRPSTPIPGTEGRGVSFVETDAPVTVYLDNEEPIVLTMPPLRAAA